MRKKIIVGSIITLAVVLIAWTFLRQPSTAQPEQTELRGYQNTVNGYSLLYPSSLQQKEYSPDNVVFGHISKEQVEGVVEATIMNVEGEVGKTYEDTVGTQLMNLCAADGPTSSFSCTRVEQVQPFISVTEVSGHVFNLGGELTDLETGEKVVKGKGPFFVFPLATSATVSKVLVIHPPLNKYADEVDSALIRSVAESVHVEKSTGKKMGIEAYVSANISDLAPEKEQLGGKFYVTTIEANGNSGTVEYEDGHNAYTADFAYTTDEQGIISVTSFTVRK